MGRKVYIVTIGSDMNYAIVAVYTSKKHAGAHINRFAGRLEEWSVNTLVNELKECKSIFRVKFNNTGTMTECRLDNWHWNIEDANKCIENSSGYMTVYVWAVDLAHAQAIAIEKHTQYLASKVGL